MSSKEIAPLPREELHRLLAMMGPAPVLSTEDPKAFEELLFNFAQCLKPRDFLMVQSVWEIAVNTWTGRRYMFHSTIALDRFARNKMQQDVRILRNNKVQLQSLLATKTKGNSTYPADVAGLASLQREIDDTVKDIDAILGREPNDIDMNRALSVNADFLHELDQLTNGVNRRRYDAYVFLDKHKAELDREAEEADKVVDAEFSEVEADITDETDTAAPVPPAITASPSIVSTGAESTK
jgi:hypothetical protein